MNQQFSIILADLPDPTDASVVERIFEAGCNDCTPCVHNGRLRLDFDREAKSCSEACDKALKQLRAAGFIRLITVPRPYIDKRSIKAFKFSVHPWGLPRKELVLFFSKHPTWAEVKDAFDEYAFQSWGGVPCGQTPEEAEHSKFIRECGSIIYKACGDVKIEGFGSEIAPPPKKKPYLKTIMVGDGQVELKRSWY
jgi:hypothetical protein